MKLIKRESMRKAQESMARTILEDIERIKSRGKKIVLLLSGGSAIDAYDVLAAELAKQELDLANVTVGIVDERIFTQEQVQRNLSDINSFRIAETFLPKVINKLGGEFDGYDFQNVEQVNLYNKFIDQTFPDDNIAKLAVMGIGMDGHTAGVKPDEDESEFVNRFQSEALLAEFAADDYYRSTLTITALKQLDKAYLYAINDKKRQILQKLFDDQQISKQEYSQFPAKVLTEIETEVFTDIQDLA